jgi:hypothetical protein
MSKSRGMHALDPGSPAPAAVPIDLVGTYRPADRYGWVESAHQVILHYWLDQYLNVHGLGAV